MRQPPYSPDLAPSDFHLFGPMKDYLRGYQFTDDDRNEVRQRSGTEISMYPTFFCPVYGLPRGTAEPSRARSRAAVTVDGSNGEELNLGQRLEDPERFARMGIGYSAATVDGDGLYVLVILV